MANVEKYREYKDKDGNVLVRVENGADASNVDLSAINGVDATDVQGALEELNDRLADIEQGGGGGSTISSDAASVGYSNSASGLSATNVQTAIDELAANAGHELAASVLSPVQVWNDDFATDKTVSLYVEPYTNQSGTYTHRVVTTPSSLSAYQMIGTSINRTNLFSAYVPFRKSGDKLALQQCYTADLRETTWQVELVDVNASIKIGFFVLTFNDGSGNTTQAGSQPNQNSGTGSFVVDFDNKTIKGVAMNLSPAVGKRYFIKITTVDKNSSVTITNVNDNTETQTVNLNLDMRCSPYIEWVAGSFNIRKLTVTVYGGACDYYITGDSIVYNATSQVPNPSDRWANKFRADKCPNTVISCRGQSNHEEVLLRLTSEILPLKPKCVIDENYVNGASSTYLNIMKDVCAENGIDYIHTMPTPTAAQPYNWVGNSNFPPHMDKSSIITSGVKTIRFDEATSVNGDVTQGQDTTMFVSDSGSRIHPNTKGSLAMYQRLIDELGL